MNLRQSSLLNRILAENTDRATRRAAVEEYARLAAQPLPAGTRVRTPWGTGTVVYPDAVPVVLDGTGGHTRAVLVPTADLTVVEKKRVTS